MNIIENLKLKSRINELGKLKTDYGIHEKMNREKLILFLKDPKKMIGIDINGVFGDLFAPIIFVAVRTNDFDLFQLVISIGGNEDIVYEEMTLYDAICVWATNLTFFDYLEKKGNNFSRETKWGTTPIIPIVNTLSFESIKNEQGKENRYADIEKVYKYLLSKKIDINYGGKGKPSPLMIAAKISSISTIKQLLSDGADKNRKYFIEEIEKEMNCKEFYKYTMKHDEKEINETIVNMIQ
jgi:hypothetical protein